MSRLNPCDFYNLHDLYTPEQQLIVQKTRDFVEKKCAPHIKHWFEKGIFPRELVYEMGERGFLGANLQGYGCAGVDHLSYGLMMKELEGCDSGLRSFASVQTSLCMYAIHAFGSEEHKKKYLPRMASGELVGCFALTEPDGGSNPAAMKTFATQNGTDYLLNGAKNWITNAPIADIAIVWANTAEGIRGFLVETKSQGITRSEIEYKLSLRASSTGSLSFQNCLLPQENLLPKTIGLKNALNCLNQARFGISFGVLGAAEACLTEALNYTKERILFNKPLAGFQLVQQKLAQMATEITKANLISLRLAQLKQENKATPAQISMAKQNNVKIAMECARTTRDLLGANGVSGEYACMRHMCNLESVYTYEGTNDIHVLVVGQELTGLAAFES